MNDEKLVRLAEKIVLSEQAGDVFESFSDRFAPSKLLSLLSLIFDDIRKNYGNRGAFEKARGLFAVWRVALRKLQFPESEEWLVGELGKCIPHNLHLLTNIYYYWLGTDKHTFHEREKSRRAIYEKCKSSFTTITLAEFSDGFDPAYPYNLFHLVFTSDYPQVGSVPLGSAEDWKWLGSILFESVKLYSSVMLPQILIATNSWELRRDDIIFYNINMRLLEVWFGSHTSAFIKMVADWKQIPSELSQNDQAFMKAAIRAAQEVAEHHT